MTGPPTGRTVRLVSPAAGSFGVAPPRGRGSGDFPRSGAGVRERERTKAPPRGVGDPPRRSRGHLGDFHRRGLARRRRHATTEQRTGLQLLRPLASQPPVPIDSRSRRLGGTRRIWCHAGVARRVLGAGVLEACRDPAPSDGVEPDANGGGRGRTANRDRGSAHGQRARTLAFDRNAGRARRRPSHREPRTGRCVRHPVQQHRGGARSPGHGFPLDPASRPNLHRPGAARLRVRLRRRLDAAACGATAITPPRERSSLPPTRRPSRSSALARLSRQDPTDFT